MLLDTHALVWAIGEPDRLSDAARTLIRSQQTELLVSSASAWELATKTHLGKMPGVEAWLPTWSRQLARLGAVEIPISSEHALVAGGLTWEHRDPFDRMIGAQAILEGIPLITHDPTFASLPGLRTHW